MNKHKPLIDGFDWCRDLGPLFLPWLESRGLKRQEIRPGSITGPMLEALLEGRPAAISRACRAREGRELLVRELGLIFPSCIERWLVWQSADPLDALEDLRMELGDRPEAAWAMAWRELIAGRAKAARRALEACSHLPPFAREARSMLAFLDGGASPLPGRLRLAGPVDMTAWSPAACLLDAFRHGDMIGRGPAFRALLDQLDRAAGSPLPLLLIGETGTGKELAVRYLKERAGLDGELVPVNCAALPKTLAEAELFGAVRGAFTGSTERKGLVDEAAGGILFLDEFAALDAGIQAKLLRFLEDGSYRRVGESSLRRVRLRVVCASCEEERLNGAGMRLDLLHRVSARVIRVPALRERLDDLELYCLGFLVEAGLPMPDQHPFMQPEILAALRRRSWPGNLRELRHFLLARVDVSAEELKAELLANPGHCLREAGAEVAIRPLKQALHQLEGELVHKAMQHCGEDKRQAARLLQISLPGLYSKLREHEELGRQQI
jgi:transcriptional regulator with AAA-type ATPase domain